MPLSESAYLKDETLYVESPHFIIEKVTLLLKDFFYLHTCFSAQFFYLLIP